MGRLKIVRWPKYPLRRCVWLNHCRICGKDITSGKEYYDGGYGLRAHRACADVDVQRRRTEAREQEAKP